MQNEPIREKPIKRIFIILAVFKAFFKGPCYSKKKCMLLLRHYLKIRFIHIEQFLESPIRHSDYYLWSICDFLILKLKNPKNLIPIILTYIIATYLFVHAFYHLSMIALGQIKECVIHITIPYTTTIPLAMAILIAMTTIMIVVILAWRKIITLRKFLLIKLRLFAKPYEEPLHRRTMTMLLKSLKIIPKADV